MNITPESIAEARNNIHEHGNILRSVWDYLSYPLADVPDNTPEFAVNETASHTDYYDAVKLAKAYQLLADIAQAVADKTKVEFPI